MLSIQLSSFINIIKVLSYKKQQLFNKPLKIEHNDLYRKDISTINCNKYPPPIKKKKDWRKKESLIAMVTEAILEVNICHKKKMILNFKTA